MSRGEGKMLKYNLEEKLDIANALCNSLFFLTYDDILVKQIIDTFYNENNIDKDSIMTETQADKFLEYLNEEHSKYE